MERGSCRWVLVVLAVALIVSGFVELAARRSASGARAQAEAEAFARLAGSSPVPALLESLRRIFGFDAISLLHREGDGWRTEAAAGAPAQTDPPVRRVAACRTAASGSASRWGW